MVTLNDVQIQRGGQRLFQGLNWVFPEKSITAIRKTGVLDGSTTLLQCCAGMILPSSGKITYKGIDVKTLSDKERFASLNYCYESGGLISLFTVYNNIAIPLIYHDIYTDKEARDKITRVAAELNIENLLDFEPHQLNDVQLRLVNLLRALVLDSRVIFVDELQTGMSEKMLMAVVSVIKRHVQRGCTFVMVTTMGDHDEFADHHLAIANKTLELRY